MQRKILTLIDDKNRVLGRIELESLSTKIAEIKVRQVCPACSSDVKKVSGLEPDYYRCQNETCKKEFGSWRDLKKLTEEGEEIKKVELTNPGIFTVKVMSDDEFTTRLDDPEEIWGMRELDELTKKNIRSLLIASSALNQVIVLKGNDTFEERTILLLISPNKTVIAYVLKPDNLYVKNRVVKIKISEVTPEEIEEAKVFIQLLPKAEKEDFEVKDFRTITVKKKKKKEEEELPLVWLE